MRSKTEVIKDIEKILEEYIQPTVQMHGGMVSLQDFDDGVATIFMSGACSGCAMSTQTLHMGIENMLKYYINILLYIKKGFRLKNSREKNFKIKLSEKSF